MTDILCKWLNDDVKLSSVVDKENVSRLFSSGFLFGEILFKYGLQDDFSFFSKGRTAESKLNNFTRIESVVKLLEIPYNINVAKSIMNENHGAASRLLYQLFIALGRKAKKKLTGVAMETMRPSAPVKLESIERAIYKEQLKQIVPRQVDVNFETMMERYQNKRKHQEELAFKAKKKEEFSLKKYKEDMRQQGLEKSRLIRDKQNEVMQRIKDAQLNIQKPPPSKRLLKTKKEVDREMEIQEVKEDIALFEETMKNLIPHQSSMQPEDYFEDNQRVDYDRRSRRKPLQPILLKTSGDDYVSQIKKKLNESSVARKEREKRRRRVLIEQLKAHEAQEEERREEMLVKRLMRQSQQEKRITVQLMQIRREKQIIKENRIFREKQFAERRLKDFEDALNREAEMCLLSQIEYKHIIERDKQQRKELLEERRKAKYEKHFDICKKILSDVLDLSCKIGEYRELTDRNVPEKLIREWKGYFDAALPLYQPSDLCEDEMEKSKLAIIEEEKNLLTDESDFVEYRMALGEWQQSDDTSDHIPPKDNPILGHIIQKLFKIIYPPECPSPTPDFPPFPIKACFLGKFFTGKTSAANHFVSGHRVVSLCIDDLVKDVIEIYHAEENKKEIINNIKTENEALVEEKPVDQDDKTFEHSMEETKENHEASSPSRMTEVNEEFVQNKTTEEELKEENSVAEKASSRAILGKKAYACLKKGKEISDQILVDIMIDAIREIPSGTGWILDGFPSTINQAKLLEKSLTGYDATKDTKTKDGKTKGKKSRIAPDPHPDIESPPVKSGIDTVILFDVSDEVILRRSEGRTYIPSNGEVYHQEFNPPLEGSYTGVGKQEKIHPFPDPSNDKEQIQQRITGFDESWSKLEKWFNKFGILTKLDVHRSIEEVNDNVTSTLMTFMEKIQENEKKDDIENTLTNALNEVTEQSTIDDSMNEKKDNASNTLVTNEEIKDKKIVSPQPSQIISNDDSSPRKSVSPKSSKKNIRPGSKKTSPSVSRKGSKIKSSTAIRAGLAKSPVKKQELVEDEPVEPVIQNDGPEPGSKEWEYVNEAIENSFVDILVNRWENIEETYIDTCKKVFREIRQERELIYRYFYGTRKDFLSFLRRPDEKEEYVLQWQNYYNDITQDMRSDDDVKAELHQQVDDLCDRLHEICDNRKEMAEKERNIVKEDGWLQDRLGLLINHYLTLMQIEVDRYQDTYRVLKDYYNSVEGKPPVEACSEICRIPLVDLPAIVPTLQSSVSDKSCDSEARYTTGKRDGENAKSPDGATAEGENHRNRIPLVPRRPKSGDGALMKEKNNKRSSKEKRDNQCETPVLPLDPDERLIFDGFYNALAVIDNLANLDQGEQEEEANKMAEVLREKEKDIGKKRGGTGKDKKTDKKARKSANKGKVQETVPSAPLSVEAESEEEKTKKILKEKIRREFLAAVHFEDVCLRSRVEMVRNRSVAVLQDLKTKADSTYQDMDDWLGERFLQEMESIQAMADLARNAIEKEERLQHRLTLEDKDFIVDLDVHVYETASPPPPLSPREMTENLYFTVVQLTNLYKQFVEAAPSGLISCRAFIDMFLDLTSTSFGMEMLPDLWSRQTSVQLQTLASQISLDSEFVNWKRFLLLASSPLAMPSRKQLLDMISKFKKIDRENMGFVNENEFLQVKLWFMEEDDEDNSYPRLKLLKQLFFKIFCDSSKVPPALNYEDFLLHFSMDENPVKGLLKALMVVCRQPLPSLSFFRNDVNLMKDEEKKTHPVAKVTANVPGGNAKITLGNLVKVLRHGGNESIHGQRFKGASSELKPLSTETLSGVYVELGGNDTVNSLPFHVLYQHPIIQDFIETCCNYKYHNLESILKSDRLERSSLGET